MPTASDRNSPFTQASITRHSSAGATPPSSSGTAMTGKMASSP